MSAFATVKKVPTFTPKMKFRIDSDVCDSQWCKPVSTETLDLINQYFSENPEDYEKFISAPFIDKPAVATAWVELNSQQLAAFEQAMKELSDLFTYESAMKVFSKYGLSDCFTRPSANYMFICKHTLWELDDNFNPIFKDPELRPD